MSRRGAFLSLAAVMIAASMIGSLLAVSERPKVAPPISAAAIAASTSISTSTGASTSTSIPIAPPSDEIARSASDPFYSSPLRRVAACERSERWMTFGRAGGASLRSRGRREFFEPVPKRYHCDFEPFADEGAFESISGARFQIATPKLAGVAFEFPNCTTRARLGGGPTDPWGCFRAGPLGVVRIGARELRATFKVHTGRMVEHLSGVKGRKVEPLGEGYPLVWAESRDDGRSWAWRSDQIGPCPMNSAGARVCHPNVATFGHAVPFTNNLALASVPLAREGPGSDLRTCVAFSGNIGESLPEARLWTSPDCLRNWTAFQEIDRKPCPYMDTLNSFLFDSHFGCWRAFTRHNLAVGVRGVRSSSCCARALADCGPRPDRDALPGSPGTLARWSRWEPVEMPWPGGSLPGAREEYCESPPARVLDRSADTLPFSPDNPGVHPLPGSPHVLISTPLVFAKSGKRRLRGTLGLFASRDGGQTFRRGASDFVSSAKYPPGALLPDDLPEANGYSRFALAPAIESRDGRTTIFFAVEGPNLLSRQPRLLRFEIPRGRIGSIAPKGRDLARVALSARPACGDGLTVAYAPVASKKGRRVLQVRAIGAKGLDFSDSRVVDWGDDAPIGERWAKVAWPEPATRRLIGSIVRLEMRFSGIRAFGFEWTRGGEPLDRARDLAIVRPAEGSIALADRPEPPTAELVIEAGKATRDAKPIATLSDRGIEAGAVRGAFEPSPRRAPISVSWDLLPDFPRGGIESLGLAMLDDRTLVAVGGFCGGDAFKSAYYNCMPRGFRNETWTLDVRDREWSRGPDFPGEARQGQTCASIGGAAYCFGGFAYRPLRDREADDPVALSRKKTGVKSFADCYKFARVGGSPRWSRLPDEPVVCVRPALVVAPNGTVLLVGGGLFDGAWWDASRCGRSIRAFDPISERWWTPRLEFPGVGRMMAAAAVARGELFVIGGVAGGDGLSGRYAAALDNFAVDLATGRARALPENPWGCSNHFSGALWAGRYLIASGGASYAEGSRSDGRGGIEVVRSNLFGCHPDALPITKKSVFRDIFAFDVATETFTNSHALRKPVALNEGFILWKDSIYSIGGEGEHGRGTVRIGGVDYSGRHSRIALAGFLRPDR